MAEIVSSPGKSLSVGTTILKPSDYTSITSSHRWWSGALYTITVHHNSSQSVANRTKDDDIAFQQQRHQKRKERKIIKGKSEARLGFACAPEPNRHLFVYHASQNPTGTSLFITQARTQQEPLCLSRKPEPNMHLFVYHASKDTTGTSLFIPKARTQQAPLCLSRKPEPNRHLFIYHASKDTTGTSLFIAQARTQLYKR